jgi:alpha-glucosidase
MPWLLGRSNRYRQGSAWEFDEATQEYYLHLYVTKQPDLNWENPEVREAAWEVMQFWIGRGCDGFRVRKKWFDEDLIDRITAVDGRHQLDLEGRRAS